LVYDAAAAVMLEEQAATNDLLNVEFGPDPSSPLPFTFQVTGSSFSYSTNPGTTYLGKPVSITGSGTYVGTDTSGTWTCSATNTVGSSSYNITGTATSSYSAGAYTLTGAVQDGAAPDYNDVEWRGGPGDMGWLSGFLDHQVFTKNGADVGDTGAYSYDYSRVTGDSVTVTWYQVPDPSDGYNPPYTSGLITTFAMSEATGMGTFTTVTTPEPSTVAMMLAACGVLLAQVARKHGALQMMRA